MGTWAVWGWVFSAGCADSPPACPLSGGFPPNSGFPLCSGVFVPPQSIFGDVLRGRLCRASPQRGFGDRLSAQLLQTGPKVCSGNVSCPFQPPLLLACFVPLASCRPRSKPGRRSPTAASKGTGQWHRRRAAACLPGRRKAGHAARSRLCRGKSSPAPPGRACGSALEFSSSLGGSSGCPCAPAAVPALPSASARSLPGGWSGSCPSAAHRRWLSCSRSWSCSGRRAARRPSTRPSCAPPCSPGCMAACPGSWSG